MQSNKKYEVEVKDDLSNEKEDPVEDVKITSRLRRDSLFIARRRMSQRGECGNEYENDDTIEDHDYSKDNNLCGCSLQIHIDEQLSEYGSTRKNKVQNNTKWQRHVVIAKEKQEASDKKVPEDAKDN